MAIRLRTVSGRLVALCAARSIEKPGDVYLADAQHSALADKFAEDFGTEGYNTRSLDPEAAALRVVEESNNPNRAWWDRVYGPRHPR
jgi:hypothetical protein